MKHVCLNGHRIDGESSAVLAIESDYKKKDGFLGSSYIHKTDFAFKNKIKFLYRIVQIFQFLTASCRCCSCLLP